MSIDNILQRRSVREYTGEPVSEQDIRALLRAGMYAPSAMNSRPAEFIVVRERGLLMRLSEVSPYWQMLKKAPLAIHVVANTAGYKASTKTFFIQDCAASTQNILVAAEGLSLGAVWLGLYGVEDRMQKVADILKVPKDILPFSLISIGHPASHPHPHEEFYEDKVYYDIYGKDML